MWYSYPGKKHGSYYPSSTQPIRYNNYYGVNDNQQQIVQSSYQYQPQQNQQLSYSMNDCLLYNNNKVVSNTPLYNSSPNVPNRPVYNNVTKSEQVNNNSVSYDMSSMIERKDSPVRLNTDVNKLPKEIYVMFYDGSSNVINNWYKWAINRGIAMISGQYTHVELILYNYKGEFLSFEVFTGENVMFEIKKYQEDRWRWNKLNLTHEQMVSIYNFCVEQQGKPFNSYGMYMNFLPLLGSYFSNSTRDKWFCSQLITCALQAAKIPCVMDLVPEKTTPTQLFKVLQTQPELTVISRFKPNQVGNNCSTPINTFNKLSSNREMSISKTSY